MVEVSIKEMGPKGQRFDRWFLSVPVKGDYMFIDGRNYEIVLVCHYPQIGQSPAMPSVQLMVRQVVEAD